MFEISILRIESPLRRYRITKFKEDFENYLKDICPEINVNYKIYKKNNYIKYYFEGKEVRIYIEDKKIHLGKERNLIKEIDLTKFPSLKIKGFSDANNLFFPIKIKGREEDFIEFEKEFKLALVELELS